ncbi:MULTISPECIES: glycosyltransferase [unclassified Methanoculleus]|jgi:glycosyltransferase involved in cell wall biosynthesis|uniref:glycosyltransferase n=1 Tax=unclassified Methanoculleus TaxID=2619537 RepID=UPI00319DD1E3
MKELNISLIKPSDPRTDPRLIKELDSIIRAKYNVNVICMCDRDDPETSYKMKIHNLKLKGRNNFSSLLYWPIWWIYEFHSLLHIQTDIFHIFNYNSILPAIIVGRIRKIPVIYEILDTTYDALKWPGTIRNAIMFLDKMFMKYSDAIILVDECQIKQFRGIPNKNVNIIYDSAYDFGKSEITNDKANNAFIMLYIGVLYKIRQLNLDILCDVIKDIDGVKLIIAGYGDLVDDIKEWEKKSDDKIEYIGRIAYSEALKMSLNADCLVVLRSSDLNTNKYICGSKLWESMMCGRPILVNKGTSTATKVLEEDCGLVVDVHNLNELKEKIILMRDNPALCRRFGKNGRRAYEERYSWDIMEKKLLGLYRSLTEGVD